MPASIRIIPATRTRFSSQPIEAKKKRRVAAYARVSTNEEDQLSSYDAQVKYYSDYIKEKDDWEFLRSMLMKASLEPTQRTVRDFCVWSMMPSSIKR